MPTKIISCQCKHEYQDKLYGNNKRVYNKTVKGTTPDTQGYRCTVCSSLSTKNKKKKD